MFGSLRRSRFRRRRPQRPRSQQHEPRHGSYVPAAATAKRRHLQFFSVGGGWSSGRDGFFHGNDEEALRFRFLLAL